MTESMQAQMGAAIVQAMKDEVAKVPSLRAKRIEYGTQQRKSVKGNYDVCVVKPTSPVPISGRQYASGRSTASEFPYAIEYACKDPRGKDETFELLQQAVIGLLADKGKRVFAEFGDHDDLLGGPGEIEITDIGTEDEAMLGPDQFRVVARVVWRCCHLIPLSTPVSGGGAGSDPDPVLQVVLAGVDLDDGDDDTLGVLVAEPIERNWMLTNVGNSVLAVRPHVQSSSNCEVNLLDVPTTVLLIRPGESLLFRVEVDKRPADTNAAFFAMVTFGTAHAAQDGYFVTLSGTWNVP